MRVQMPSRRTLRRYGPVAALVAALVLLVTLLPGNTKRNPTSRRGEDVRATAPDATSAPGGAASPPSIATPDSNAAGAPSGATAGGRTTSGRATKGGGETTARGGGGGAGGGGERGSPGQGSAPPLTACRSDGRMAGFSLYMPSCLPVFTADNGGATSPGVSGDKILIVRYASQLPPGLTQILQAFGVDEDDAKKQEMDDALIDFYNHHVETYGRQVVMVTKHASGTDDRQEALTRDANEIAAMKPFAVYHTQPGAPDPVFARTLASKGIICVCATSRARSLYQQTKGYVWSTQPILEEIYDATAEYVGTRLAGKPPAFAGALPRDMREANRRFGLIWVSGTQQAKDPGLSAGKEYYKRQLARYGVELAAEHEVTFDFPLMQTQAVGAIAAMKAAKVSNLLCACDPFSPIFLTREATRADYHPEWLINGFGFGDLTFFGRTRDQNQWRHAFGISAFPVPPATLASTSAYKAFTHMRPGATPGKTIMAREWAIQLLFNGIHLAGPRLTPQTFAEAMYRYPRTGGQPVHPLMYYTPDSPARVKDFAEIFWNADGSGQDETGGEGRGIMMRADGGKRYQPGQWGAFASPRRTGAVYASDTPPESLPHDADGHRHPSSQRCRSCR